MSTRQEKGATKLSSVPISVSDHVHIQVSTQCRQRPDAEALASMERTWTYQDLETRSTELSHYLQHAGVTKWHKVGICFRKSAWAIVSMLGVLKTGASCVPLDPDHPKARLQAIIDAASICTVLVERPIEVLGNFIEVHQISVNELDISHMSRTVQSKIPGAVHHDRSSDPAFVLFTSGSTGVPKAVILSHSAICSSAKYHGEPMLIGPGTRVFQHAAYTFDMSVYDIFTTLIRGGTVCIPSAELLMQHVVQSVKQLRSNWAFFTPTLLSTLHPDELPGLNTILLAGEHVSQELVDVWASRTRLLNGYGSTEMSTCFLSHLTSTSDPKNIGTPQGVAVGIVDLDHPTKTAHNNTGELVVCGPVLASGYLSENSQTTAFSRDPVFGGNMTYRTGDIVEKLTDGSYLFLGRRDSMVKIRGYRVELGEIEHHLRSHPLVLHAVVLYPKKGKHTEKLTAVVQLSTDSESGASHIGSNEPSYVDQVLAAHLNNKLPKYMIPQAWLTAHQMDLTSSGKIDRRAINSAVEQGLLKGIDAPHKQYCAYSEQGPLSSHAITSASMSTPENSNALTDVAFLDLGLDSINLIGLSKILKKAYNLDLDVATLGMMSLASLVPCIYPTMYDGDITPELALPTQPRLLELFCRVRSKFQEACSPQGVSPLALPLPALSLRSKTDPPPNVLLTGATGFVGARILECLMTTLPPQSKIVALIRAETPSHGLRRLLDTLDNANIALSCEDLARLEVWPGDLSKPQLGLDKQQWDRLRGCYGAIANAIDIVVHNGAVVNWSMAYEALEAANVHSTMALLRVLQKRTKPAMMVYVSGGRALEVVTDCNLILPSMAASEGSVLDDTKTKWDAIETSCNSLVGYDISKLFSDSVVKSSMSCNTRGLPPFIDGVGFDAHIVRPGYIIGNSTTGQVNAEDYIWRVIATALRLHKRCEEPATSFLYLSGVDDVAKQIVQPLRIMCEPATTQNPGSAVESNITAGVTMHDFWTAVSSVHNIQLVPMAPTAWLAAVDKDMLGHESQEDHPLYSMVAAHRADGGLLGLERTEACERGSDATALRCLEMSLRYLQKEAEAFKMWLGA
ncbi:acetyl-CoA synthetase-like protein [Ophiobolus disseminans]|uniref:Acetyl-CoA synthetase-like protein n=1 Tax=Ophiobolus disseminans TaxID=1469910 RepID=A0A6A6ZJ41_9PLEO|nr:acetyl-CoA synthetase-like protein [Ophiobolus disseminans]